MAQTVISRLIKPFKDFSLQSRLSHASFILPIKCVVGVMMMMIYKVASSHFQYQNEKNVLHFGTVNREEELKQGKIGLERSAS